MPAVYQTVSIPMAQGLDSKTDPRKLEGGKLVRLENGSFEGVNLISKRAGHQPSIGGNATARGRVYSAITRAQLLDESLSGTRPVPAGAEDFDLGNGNERDNVKTLAGPSVLQSELVPVPAPAGATVHRSLMDDDYIAVMLDERLVIYDRETYSVVSDYYTGATAANYTPVNVHRTTNRFRFVFADGNTIKLVQFVVLSRTFEAEVIVATDYRGPGFAIGSDDPNGFGYIGYYRSGTPVGTIKFRSLDPFYTGEITALFADETITQFSMAEDFNSGRVVLCALQRTGTGGVGYTVHFWGTPSNFSDTGDVDTTSVVIDQNGSTLNPGITGATPDNAAISAIYDPSWQSAPRVVRVFYSSALIDASANTAGKFGYIDFRADTGSVMLSTAIEGSAERFNQLGGAFGYIMAGRPIVFNDEWHVPVLFISTDARELLDDDVITSELPTRFALLRLVDSEVCAVELNDRLVDKTAILTALPMSSAREGGTSLDSASWVLPYFRDLGPDGNGRTRQYAAIEIGQTDVAGPNVVEARGVGVVASAYPSVLETDRVVPIGYPAPATIRRSPFADSAEGSLSNGVYQFAAIYAWEDDSGNVYRSAPVFFTQNFPSGGGFTDSNGAGDFTPSDSIFVVGLPDLEVPFPRGMTAELYRTEANGGVLYFVASTPVVAGDQATEFTNAVATVADSTIVDNAALYTTAELANLPPPSATAVELHQNRVWLAVGDRLRYSKPLVDGAGIGFSPVLDLGLGGDASRVVALQSLNASLVALEESRIARVVGEGPNASGAGGTFQLLPVNSPQGCVNRRSVVVVPDGIMFQSSRGIELLDQSFRVNFVGLPVANEFDADVVGAFEVPELSEVRWYLSNAKVVVYSYLTGQWATWRINTGSLRSAFRTSEGLIYLGTGTHSGMLQNDGFSNDNGGFYALAARTGWLHSGNPQSFLRVSRVGVLANKIGNHTLTINVYFDYSDVVVESFTFDATNTPVFDRYQIRTRRLKRQKCAAVSIELVSSLVNNRSLTISDITLDLAVETGISRLPAAETV